MEPLLFISKDGKYLYEHLTVAMIIAVYTILADGSLELLEIVLQRGQRLHVILIWHPTKFLIVVHIDSDNATVFKRNCDNGRLAENSNDTHVPPTVCIRFAP